MEKFWYTVETVPKGIGMGHFTPAHITVLVIGFAVCALCCLLFSKLDKKKQKTALNWLAGLLVANELYKWVCLFIVDGVTVNYLPLHLCSINIFMCALYVFFPKPLIAELLYALCLPGALMALLFPTWTSLPLFNFMNIHSTTVHFELILFSLLLIVGGMRPNFRLLPKCGLVLVCMAAVIYPLNLLLGTNFMFVMYAPKGTPLVFFEKLLGNPGFLLGFPVMAAVLWFVMYLPWEIAARVKAKKALP